MAKGNSEGIVIRLKFKQSAAKCPRNRVKVQRIGYGVLTGRAEDSKNPRAQNT